MNKRKRVLNDSSLIFYLFFCQQSISFFSNTSSPKCEREKGWWDRGRKNSDSQNNSCLLMRATVPTRHLCNMEELSLVAPVLLRKVDCLFIICSADSSTGQMWCTASLFAVRFKEITVDSLQQQQQRLKENHNLPLLLLYYYSPLTNEASSYVLYNVLALLASQAFSWAHWTQWEQWKGLKKRINKLKIQPNR